jgi:hypothetical protein
MEKRLFVCLNKEDWYDAHEERALASQIADQLPGVAREDIVAVRAAAATRPRVRVLPDGTEECDVVEVPPDVRPLAKRMLQVVRRDGGDSPANLLQSRAGRRRETTSPQNLTSGPIKSFRVTCGPRAARRESIRSRCSTSPAAARSR